MIEKILIENYRGIEKLEVNNLKKYNIFVGDNSSCKTTLLEALFCSFFTSYAADIVTMANYRGITVKKENIHNFIYNADLTKSIRFILDNKIETIIKIDENKKLENDNISGATNQSFSNKIFSMASRGEKFLFNIVRKINNKLLIDMDYYLDESYRINPKINNNTSIAEFSEQDLLEIEKISNNNKSWISPYVKNSIETANRVKSIIENKKKDELLRLINLFETEVDDIFSDGEEIQLSKKNIAKMLPLSSFGNGLSAIINIISHIVLDDIKFLFIDEIESGIHYLNYEKFCSALIEVTNTKDIQIFMSTHSKEFLEIFCKKIKKVDEDISLYRFKKIKNVLKGIHYSKEEIIDSIENEWEIR
ncbi:AAA family ATPase [uncultured Fusobacterium sp.]|uniref:AAA family ATPase n=1 Tax=uncultured Fusobacterium sp. TaxID=159267 RepID=UPI0015A71747|nr:AAA family ATPase [uncultured Fusobacterium sp.]